MILLLFILIVLVIVIAVGRILTIGIILLTILLIHRFSLLSWDYTDSFAR